MWLHGVPGTVRLEFKNAPDIWIASSYHDVDNWNIWLDIQDHSVCNSKHIEKRQPQSFRHRPCLSMYSAGENGSASRNPGEFVLWYILVMPAIKHTRKGVFTLNRLQITISSLRSDEVLSLNTFWDKIICNYVCIYIHIHFRYIYFI